MALDSHSSLVADLCQEMEESVGTHGDEAGCEYGLDDPAVWREGVSEGGHSVEEGVDRGDGGGGVFLAIRRALYPELSTETGSARRVKTNRR